MRAAELRSVRTPTATRQTIRNGLYDHRRGDALFVAHFLCSLVARVLPDVAQLEYPRAKLLILWYRLRGSNLGPLDPQNRSAHRHTYAEPIFISHLRLVSRRRFLLVFSSLVATWVCPRLLEKVSRGPSKLTLQGTAFVGTALCLSSLIDALRNVSLTRSSPAKPHGIAMCAAFAVALGLNERSSA